MFAHNRLEERPSDTFCDSVMVAPVHAAGAINADLVGPAGARLRYGRGGKAIEGLGIIAAVDYVLL